MSSMRNPPAGNNQSNQRSRPNQQPPNYGNQASSSQDFSIPPYLYVERRSSNPVPVTQINQPQYVDPNRPSVGYDTARAYQAQSSGMYKNTNVGGPSRNVNPALRTNPLPASTSQYATFGKESLFAKKETRAEIDDTPIIDPNAFYHLNLGEKRPTKKPAPAVNQGGIDSRPIINLDGVTQLERRRQQQLEKSNRLRGDDGSGAGIDERSIVDANAFRHIEAKASQPKQNDPPGQGNSSGIDSRPITNPDAFKFLESRREQKPVNASNDLAIDTRPIINPDAFKYLEQRRDPSSQSNEESGIDAKPIVNPDAFRYLEQRNVPTRRDIDAGVDTSSRINPNAFQYIERKVAPRPDLSESTIDYRPIVNPQAFKWIEREEPPRRVDDGPEVDERSYVNPQAFQYIDRRPGKVSDVCKPEIDTRSFILERNPKALAHLEREPIERKANEESSGIDERSYVNPQSFRYLEGMGNEPPTARVHSSAGPTIDTKSYVNPNSFRHLEGRDEGPREVEAVSNERAVDERSYVPPTAFRHLEFTGENYKQTPPDYSAYGGQSDL